MGFGGRTAEGWQGPSLALRGRLWNQPAARRLRWDCPSPPPWGAALKPLVWDRQARNKEHQGGKSGCLCLQLADGKALTFKTSKEAPAPVITHRLRFGGWKTLIATLGLCPGPAGIITPTTIYWAQVCARCYAHPYGALSPVSLLWCGQHWCYLPLVDQEMGIQRGEVTCPGSSS